MILYTKYTNNNTSKIWFILNEVSVTGFISPKNGFSGVEFTNWFSMPSTLSRRGIDIENLNDNIYIESELLYKYWNVL